MFIFQVKKWGQQWFRVQGLVCILFLTLTISVAVERLVVEQFEVVVEVFGEIVDHLAAEVAVVA